MVDRRAGLQAVGWPRGEARGQELTLFRAGSGSG